MAHELEPPSGRVPDWDRLYLARGATEIVTHRPVFTGDVFQHVTVNPPRGSSKVKTVIVIQHPCALREDGVALRESVLVAEVRRWPVLLTEKWNTTGKIMPLPSLLPQSASSQRNQAALFERTYHTHPDDLTERIAIVTRRCVGYGR